jgi:hypothetical protein
MVTWQPRAAWPRAGLRQKMAVHAPRCREGARPQAAPVHAQRQALPMTANSLARYIAVLPRRARRARGLIAGREGTGGARGCGPVKAIRRHPAHHAGRTGPRGARHEVIVEKAWRGGDAVAAVCRAVVASHARTPAARDWVGGRVWERVRLVKEQGSGNVTGAQTAHKRSYKPRLHWRAAR